MSRCRQYFMTTSSDLLGSSCLSGPAMVLNNFENFGTFSRLFSSMASTHSQAYLASPVMRRMWASSALSPILFRAAYNFAILLQSLWSLRVPSKEGTPRSAKAWS